MTTITNLNRKPDGVFETLEANSVSTGNQLNVQNQRVYVQDIEPSNPDQGDVWLDTTEAFE